jgi:hypothetical protein
MHALLFSLACALAACAQYLVTRDDDLLALGKPFGIEMITPAGFLAWLLEVRTQEASPAAANALSQKRFR